MYFSNLFAISAGSPAEICPTGWPVGAPMLSNPKTIIPPPRIGNCNDILDQFAPIGGMKCQNRA
jgi:hypothetical protein